MITVFWCWNETAEESELKKGLKAPFLMVGLALDHAEYKQ